MTTNLFPFFVAKGTDRCREVLAEKIQKAIVDCKKEHGNGVDCEVVMLEDLGCGLRGYVRSVRKIV
jgi:hypothetical protein